VPHETQVKGNPANSYSYFSRGKLSTFFESYQQQSFAQMFAEIVQNRGGLHPNLV
jgi:hypothetical protein